MDFFQVLMVRRFINPSTIQIFFKKIPNTAFHGGKGKIPPWATALAQRHADARR
jgi:hypothetical protein